MTRNEVQSVSDQSLSDRWPCNAQACANSWGLTGTISTSGWSRSVLQQARKTQAVFRPAQAVTYFQQYELRGEQPTGKFQAQAPGRSMLTGPPG